MKKLLIANSSPEEARKIKSFLKEDFQVTMITEPGELVWKDFSIVLIDHNFTHGSGIDFLTKILKKKGVPVLMVTPPEDPQCAIDALGAGAFNYVVKTTNYIQFLYIAISEATRKFEERSGFKRTIEDLTSALSELERQTGEKAIRNQAAGGPGERRDESGTKPPPPKAKQGMNLLEEIVSRFKKGEVNLPTLPHVNLQFNELIRKEASLKEVANFLRQDVAISTKLINAANSAVYMGFEKVSRLEDAINRLGEGTTRQYVEIIFNRSLYTSSNKRFSKIMARLWEHALACACAAEYIHSLLSLKSQADIFSLGLTHDVGKLILLQVIGELGARNPAVDTLKEEEIIKTMNIYHGKFGAVLLKRWDFPDDFRYIAMNHNHIERVEAPSHEYLCVHFANCLANSMGFGLRPFPPEELERLPSYQMLRLRPEEIALIQERIREYFDGIKDLA